MTGKTTKHIAIAFLILILLVFSMPKIGKASVPTWEMNPLVTGGINSTGISTSGTWGQQLLEWAYKFTVESLRRQLLNMIVDQIVNWVQGGGNPKFITDWPGFFRDAVDQAGGRFLQQLGLGQLCSAFGPRLSAAFIPIPQFSTRSSCTLSQVGANLDAFLKSFQNGGWIAWNEMVLRPQNNIYGAYLMAWDQYEIEKSAAAKAAEAEALAGNGFLSVKRCSASHLAADPETGADVTVCDKYEIVTPGKVVGELAAQAVGSDIPYIITAQELQAYVAAIANAVLNRMFAEGVGLLSMASSGSGGGGGGGTTASAAECANLIGTSAYSDCVNAIQSGQNIIEFQKNNLIKLIEQDMTFQNQLLGAKQATLIVLNQSRDLLTQSAGICPRLSPSLATIQNDIKTITDQIAKIQSDIIALQQKEAEIKALKTASEITSAYSQTAGVINPAITQTLALSAQQETAQKQQSLAYYQQQIDICNKQLQQQSQP